MKGGPHLHLHAGKLRDLRHVNRESLYFRGALNASTSLPQAASKLSMRITRSSDVRRLLVITYHFPPDGAIGGQRWAGLSKYLARLGWEVHVITASAADAEQPAPNVHRHFRPRRRTLNDVYKAVAGRFRQRARTDHQPLREISARLPSFSPMRPVAAVRRILGRSMYLPALGSLRRPRSDSWARCAVLDRYARSVVLDP